MAELTASLIFELREIRNDILRGDAENMPADGESMRLRLEGLARQEEALTSLFVGRTDTSYVTRTYDYVPSAAMNATSSAVPLLQVSRFCG